MRDFEKVIFNFSGLIWIFQDSLLQFPGASPLATGHPGLPSPPWLVVMPGDDHHEVVALIDGPHVPFPLSDLPDHLLIGLLDLFLCSLDLLGDLKFFLLLGKFLLHFLDGL